MQDPGWDHSDTRRLLPVLSAGLSLLGLIRRLRGRESAADAFARARSEVREVLDPAERAARWHAYQRAARRDELLATLVTLGVVTPVVAVVLLFIFPRVGAPLFLAGAIPWFLYGWFDADRYLKTESQDPAAQGEFDTQRRGSGLILNATLRDDSGVAEHPRDEGR